jgi:hypothetical protein
MQHKNELRQQAEIEALLNVFLELDDGADGPPSLLYHYTDFNGFKGIIESHSLWATYCRSLNDSTELHYGENVVRSLLFDMLPPDLHDHATKGLKKEHDELFPFVACFCTSPNLLSMWREYARRGGGYCLGFDSNTLHGLTTEGAKGGYNHLVKIVYGEPDATVKCRLDDIAKYITSDPQRTMGLSYAHLLASKLKHESFKEENEWRVIVHDAKYSVVRFRQGHDNIIPYVELRKNIVAGPDPRLSLQKVVCGPTLRNDYELRKAAEWMLRRYGYDNVAVESSGIPYRL